MMFLYAILALVSIFSFFGVLFWYIDEEIFAPYGKIFEIENLNKVGKIILSVVVTPFTIIPTILTLLSVSLFMAIDCVMYTFRWFFAEDREKLRKQWLDNDDIY